MAYTWDKDLETGYVLVDNQHRQLIMLVNDLQVSIVQGKGVDEIKGTVEFLRFYVIRHFEDEENLQLKFGYGDYYEHVARHREFKLRVNELATRLYKEGPSPELVEEISECVGDWLVNHIKGDDLKMAAYIRTHSTPSAPTF
ncbi:MAG: hemerythrin family protein [Coriobacteriales bacterium]|jgi:hemerythrin|nr:hemerythrin family protein [Coriobacteriales bacterium]